MNKEQLFMVFDVESVGLHGDGFAVGWAVVNGFGVEVQYGISWCIPNDKMGTPEGFGWVRANVPELPERFRRETLREVRDCFWEQWICWKGRGAILVADCGWPVEARFLAQCVDDSPKQREWEGPYPLHELASVLIVRGKDPLAKYPRKTNELLQHNPLADARQSARILCENLQ